MDNAKFGRNIKNERNANQGRNRLLRMFVRRCAILADAYCNGRWNEIVYIRIKFVTK